MLLQSLQALFQQTDRSQVIRVLRLFIVATVCPRKRRLPKRLLLLYIGRQCTDTDSVPLRNLLVISSYYVNGVTHLYETIRDLGLMSHQIDHAISQFSKIQRGIKVCYYLPSIPSCRYMDDHILVTSLQTMSNAQAYFY